MLPQLLGEQEMISMKKNQPNDYKAEFRIKFHTIICPVKLVASKDLLEQIKVLQAKTMELHDMMIKDDNDEIENLFDVLWR